MLSSDRITPEPPNWLLAADFRGLRTRNALGRKLPNLLTWLLASPQAIRWLAVFLAWLALVFVLGARGAFVATPGSPPLGLLIGLLAPLSLFLVGYWAIRPLREFVLSIDPRIIVGVQAWRWAGFGFLTLYTYGVLPGLFAWPAGLGDMAIGLTAPLMLAALLHRPGFAASKSFVAWNLSGILDLTVALSIGAVVPLLAPNLFGTVSTAPMTRLPLVLVPTLLVPMFLMLHLAALFQAGRRTATRSEATGSIFRTPMAQG